MSNRFPIPAKILVWFTLNLVLIAVAAWAVMQHQMGFGFDALLAGGAGDRLRSAGDLILQDLSEHPRDEWDAVLARYQRSYPVRFYLFSDNGPQLAGDPIVLPPEVRSRLQSRPQPGPGPGPGPGLGPRREGPPGDRPQRQPPGLIPGVENPLPPPRPPLQPRPAIPRMPTIAGFLRAGAPPQYWVLLRGPINRHAHEGPATLIFASETLSAGGLIFDATPILWAGAGMLTLSVLFWLPLVAGITRSIARLRTATARIAEGHFDVRVEDRRSDELGALGTAVNTMAERLAGMVHGQRRFLSDVAHELCAPLARLQMALGILEERQGEKGREQLADVREEVDQMAGLVNELLSFSRASLGSNRIELKPVSVQATIEQAVRRESANSDAKIEVDCSQDYSVEADPDLLQRALGNLLRNAIRYAAHAGSIRVCASAHEQTCEISVIDSGPGVAPEFLSQLFDPFYRVDTSRTRETGGVGLGLTIAKTCVEACRGTITAENVGASGLKVSIRLTRGQSHSQPGK